MWNEALNQVGIEAFSALRRVESVYYPSAICAPGPANSKADTSSEVVELRKGSLAKAPPSSGNQSKKTQQQGVTEKEVDTNKRVAPDATKPSTVPHDPPKEKEVPSTMEIVLATLPLPT